jgi:hypothetical protein
MVNPPEIIFYVGISTTFYLEDIDFVRRSISFNKEAKRGAFLPWDGYSHSVIYLKNGMVFTITSLFVQDLYLPIEEEKITIKTNFFRLAKLR